MDVPNIICDWRKACILGSGGFGIVTLWINEITNDKIAVKQCRWNSPEQIPIKEGNRWTKEVDIIRNIHHENIVGFKNLPDILECELSKHNASKLPFLSMEYCTEGNLRRCLGKQPNACGLPEIEVRYILRDISSAIKYLHGLEITHRDLKPENIVLQKSDSRPTKIIYKVIDLGLAKEINSEVASFVGNLQYLSPEVFLHHNYNYTGDYWSFGIVVFEIICGIHPFLPNMSPIQRFNHISKKSPNDICIYVSRSGEIKYSDKIVNENHISPLLKKLLEKWLRFLLAYDSCGRGVTGTTKDIFEELDDILNKNILCVFSVYNYQNFYYEIEDNTLLTTVQKQIAGDTNIPIDEQLLIMDNMYYDINPERKILECMDEVNKESMVILFKKGYFVGDTETQLPVVVKNLFNDNKKKYTWNVLYSQIAHTVHFICDETKLMRSLSKAFLIELDYLQNLFKKEAQTFESLKSSANKMLIEVTYCKAINANINDIYLNEFNMTFVKKYRKHLQQTRELIENVNAATSRHTKLQCREHVMRASSDTIGRNLNKFNPDFIYESALNCLTINKQNSALTSEEIIKAVNACLKSKCTLLNDENFRNFIKVSTKVIRELNKLLRWMAALHKEIDLLSNDMMINEQDLISNIFKQCNFRKFPQSSSFTFINVDVDHLLEENIKLRSAIQDVLGKLLCSYKNYNEEIYHLEDFLGTPV